MAGFLLVDIFKEGQKSVEISVCGIWKGSWGSSSIYLRPEEEENEFDPAQ